MNRPILFPLLVTSLALVLGPVGCKKSPKGVTPIPEPSATDPVMGPDPSGPGSSDLSGGGTFDPNRGVGGDIIEIPEAGLGQAPRQMFEGMEMDEAALSDRTVYFDFDSAFVKVGEQYKVNAVGDLLLELLDHKLVIDGHCDERGTEEYNRSLGQRRADALREYLVTQVGIPQDRIWTRSFGEDDPADPGHDDTAWAQNRRGEFVLLRPPGTNR